MPLTAVVAAEPWGVGPSAGGCSAVVVLSVCVFQPLCLMQAHLSDGWLAFFVFWFSSVCLALFSRPAPPSPCRVETRYEFDRPSLRLALRPSHLLPSKGLRIAAHPTTQRKLLPGRRMLHVKWAFRAFQLREAWARLQVTTEIPIVRKMRAQVWWQSSTVTRLTGQCGSSSFGQPVQRW
jgi:hypothetical protein